MNVRKDQQKSTLLPQAPHRTAPHDVYLLLAGDGRRSKIKTTLRRHPRILPLLFFFQFFVLLFLFAIIGGATAASPAAPETSLGAAVLRPAAAAALGDSAE